MWRFLNEKIIILCLLSLSITACEKSEATSSIAPNNPSVPSPYAKQLQITAILPIPNNVAPDIRKYFNRYTQVIAPNNKAITIYAQDQITELQIIQARNTLLFYLTDIPSSTYGTDKAAIANQMANNGAVLNLLNGVDDDSNPASKLSGQPLYAGELVVPGSQAYMTNDFEQRDATFEEILHLVHDTGIGVDGKGGQPGALPAFQSEIRAATNNAISNNFQIWPTTAVNNGSESQWFNELKQENSLTQEYLAAVIDSYYGLWGAFKEANGGMWGFYKAKTRENIKIKDPKGWALTQKFFSPYLTYNAQLDPSLTGTFSMSFKANQPYTYKSQYLLYATLTGDNNSNLEGNDQNNHLSGNKGNNILNGLSGQDTALFPRAKSNYTLTKNNNGSIQVIGDGNDTLINIEEIQFSDQKIMVKDL